MSKVNETPPAKAAGHSVSIVLIGNDRDYFLHHRRAIVERLAAMGARVTVITGGRTASPGEDGDWASIHMPIDRLSLNPFTNLLLLTRSFGHIRRIRPDVLHLLTLKPAVFGGLAAVLYRLGGGGPERILITIPGLGRLMSPRGAGAGWLSPFARWAISRIVRFLSNRRSVRFSFETAHDRNLWVAEGLVREDNSTVINGAGCDPRKFHPAPQQKPRERIRILFASRLLRSKGLDAFVDMARRLAHRPDAEFIVAGMRDPRDPDEYPVETLERDKSISFLGPVSEMAELLRRVDLVCLPTRYGEGIPRILIEAAASGVACLATDIDGCREIVEHGTTGTLVPAGANGQLTDNITAAATAYLDDPEKLRRHGRAGLDKFHAGGFSESAVVDRFVELLLGKSA